MTREKRRIPRLELTEPIDASLSGRNVALIDLSNGGAQVEHEFPLKAGSNTVFEFVHKDTKVSLACQIVRTRLGRSTMNPGSFAYASGLRFTDPSAPARQVVRRIVAEMSQGRGDGS